MGDGLPIGKFDHPCGARERRDMQERAHFESCPFCGGVGVPFQLPEPAEFCVECADCGAASPIITAVMDDPVPALEQAWNRREFPIRGATYSVLDERLRQVDLEGYDRTHDDQWTEGQMAKAAVAYVVWGAGSGFPVPRVDSINTLPPPGWPWDGAHWKPTNRRRDLVKAAALLIAEIDRLDRVPRTDADAF
jgi:hypothetical protein